MAILSRVGLDDVVAGVAGAPGFPHAEARAVSATCGGIRVHSVYVPNGRVPDSEHYHYKLAWLAALREVVGAGPEAAMVCGDMNIAPTDADVFDPDAYVGQTHVTPPERAALAELQALGLRDVVRDRWPTERVFTYWDYRAGMFHQDLGMRIDLVLASATVAGRVRAAWVDRQARKGTGPSDHAPVIVDLDEAPDGDIGPVVPPPSAPAAKRGSRQAAPVIVTATMGTTTRGTTDDVQVLRELEAVELDLPAGLEVSWLGVSGYRLTYEGVSLFIDPYVSRVPLRSLLLRRVAMPEEAMIDRYAGAPGAVAGVLIGHTHFDHAVDAPAIARRYGAKAYGSPSLAHLMHLHGVGDLAVEVVAHQSYELGPFVVRFVPSRHSKLLFGRKVPMDGELHVTISMASRRALTSAVPCGVFASMWLALAFTIRAAPISMMVSCVGDRLRCSSRGLRGAV